MKLFVIAFGLYSLTLLGEAALLGAQKCTYGPSFWCESIPNAKQCNAVKHCIQTVWETKVLPEDNDNICLLCKEMVAEARDQLQSNQTQEEIRQVFEGTCKLIPIPLVRDECIQLSNQFIPELIETLVSQMNPQMVCATAGLCNSERIDRLLNKYKGQLVLPKITKSGRGEDCKLCTAFIDRLITDIKNNGKEYLLNHLLAICGKLSSLSSGCMALVEVNYQAIYEFFTNGMKPMEICTLFGMCAEGNGIHSTQIQKTEDTPCDFCVAIVSNWRTNLISNTTKEEFKMILDGICHQTGQFERECLSLVDQYFEVLYDVLVSEIHPKEICESVGLCGMYSIFNSKAPIWTTLGMRPEDQLPLLPLSPAFTRNDLIGRDEANSYSQNVHLPRVPLFKASIEVVSLGESGVVDQNQVNVEGREMCVMCEFVLHFLQNVLNDKMTREEIKNELDVICTKLPHSVTEECQDYVDAYADQLIQLVILNIDPATICPALNLCPKKKLTLGEPTCVICEFVMVKVDDMLKDKKTEEEIKSVVEKVCKLLPKDIASECHTFVDTYIDQVVDLIVNDYTPKEICAEMGLCKKGLFMPVADPVNAQLPVSRYFVPSVVRPDFGVEPKNEKQSTMCVLCEFAMAKIDSLILKNSTEKDIRKAFEKVCSILPTSLMNDCLGFMEEYGNSIIELLVNDLKPAEVCTAIHMCKNNFHSGLPKAVVELPLDDCSVCKEVLDWIQSQGQTDVIITSQQIVSEECPRMPRKEEAVCIDLAMKYGDYLQEIFLVLKDANAVCQSIQMCPLVGRVRRASPPIVGANRCTWGPSYWCQSRTSAQECGQVQYCTDKVWPQPIPGSEKCTRGPGYWCQSLDTARECKQIRHCVDEWDPQPSPVGGDPCTWGPAHWCKSEENARTCNALDHCRENVWKTPILGQDKCTRGPGYWCLSLDNARQCGQIRHCYENEWLTS